jgi:hypothetical protein
MKPNDHVGWKWGGGIATGIVKAVRSERTEIESNGKKIVRNGTPDDPAIITRHDKGATGLKAGA